jgi:hypothetical protein
VWRAILALSCENRQKTTVSDSFACCTSQIRRANRCVECPRMRLQRPQPLLSSIARAIQIPKGECQPRNGSVQRDAIRTAGTAWKETVARVGRTDTTFFIPGTPYMSPDRACPRGDLRGGYMVELGVPGTPDMSPDRACPGGDLRSGYMVELRVSKQYTIACQKPQPAASRWLVDCLRLASFPCLVFDPLCSPVRDTTSEARDELAL